MAYKVTDEVKSKGVDCIIVHRSGMITGIKRYTELPFAALRRQELNIMCPSQAEKRAFMCWRSDNGIQGQREVEGNR